MEQFSSVNQLTPVQVKTARAITAALFVVSVAGPWFPVLNIPRTGFELAGLLGFWFEYGLPATFLFSIFAILVLMGVTFGMDILIELGSYAWQKKQITFELGVIILALFLMILWMLTNKLMASLLVILAPSTLLLYAALNLVQVFSPVRLQRRWLSVTLIFSGVCMGAALMWVLSGAGGYGSNGWGFWLAWPVFVEAIAIEIMDFTASKAK
jgi:hypothetical protein